MAVTWLETDRRAYGHKAAPAAALFGAHELRGLDGALFTPAGDPVADAIATPKLTAAERAQLEDERARLRARLSYLDDMLSR